MIRNITKLIAKGCFQCMSIPLVWIALRYNMKLKYQIKTPMKNYTKKILHAHWIKNLILQGILYLNNFKNWFMILLTKILQRFFLLMKLFLQTKILTLAQVLFFPTICILILLQIIWILHQIHNFALLTKQLFQMN